MTLRLRSIEGGESPPRRSFSFKLLSSVASIGASGNAVLQTARSVVVMHPQSSSLTHESQRRRKVLWPYGPTSLTPSLCPTQTISIFAHRSSWLSAPLFTKQCRVLQNLARFHLPRGRRRTLWNTLITYFCKREADCPRAQRGWHAWSVVHWQTPHSSHCLGPLGPLSKARQHAWRRRRRRAGIIMRMCSDRGAKPKRNYAGTCSF